MSEPEKIEEEPGAQERFDQAVANALKMPPKPHEKKQKGSAQKDAPKTNHDKKVE